MQFQSDPQLKSAPRFEIPLLDVNGGALSTVDKSPAGVSSRATNSGRKSRVWAAYALLSVAAVAVALRVLASALAEPLESVTAGAAPTWMIEMTTTSAHASTAVVYGREVGFQLVRVPAATDGASRARLVPARLAKGEVHFFSLGLTSLHVQSSAPSGAAPMSFTADAPIITVYQHKDATGVRVGW